VPSRRVNAATRVYLRRLRPTDAEAFLQAVRRSRRVHQNWVKPPRTRLEYLRYLKRLSAPDHCGFVVLEKKTGHFVGVININNIIPGNFQNGFLGYYAFAGFERQGLMREAMKLVVMHAFKDLKLHRLEANIQPGNGRSIALAQNCGFVKEGYSCHYLKVAGKWRDHERWAILAEDGAF
jgi:[ribosomal protein S5]-alanine N-acetyltransferase